MRHLNGRCCSSPPSTQVGTAPLVRPRFDCVALPGVGGNEDASFERPPSGNSAGGSADAEAQRLRREAAELMSEADNWAKGAEGERRTAQRLDALPTNFVILHDLRVPDSPANIDHLVIGPTGVCVIDSKANTGRFTEGSGILWRGNRPIRDEVSTLEFICARVSEHLEVPVRGVLCYTEATLPQPVTRIDDAVAVTLNALPATITSGPAVHTPAMVEWLTRLAGELDGPPDETPSDPSNRTAPSVRRGSSSNQGGRRTVLSGPGTPAPPPTDVAAPRRRSLLPGCLAVIVLMMILLVVAVLFMAGLSRLATTIDPSTTTAEPGPPAVGVTFECRSAGAGYSAEFTYPEQGLSHTSYDVVVEFDQQELLRETWTTKYMPAPTLTGLWPGVELVVQTLASDGSTASSQSVATPVEPC